tara:strand:- start:174 stop:506 length:333 start_codon:yes stop_codon:yes gene_type:complete
MMNMQGLMKKAQEMQKKMEQLQEELGDVEVTGTSGGGMVTVVMTCKGMTKSLKVSPELVSGDDKEMMEDLVVAAMNDARTKADAKMSEETQKAMKNMGIPPGALGGGLPF